MGIVCKLEDYLIHPNDWHFLYSEMPKECRKIMDYPEPQPMGIGRNEELGWFIMATGQGPSLIWSEKKK